MKALEIKYIKHDGGIDYDFNYITDDEEKYGETPQKRIAKINNIIEKANNGIKVFAKMAIYSHAILS